MTHELRNEVLFLIAVSLTAGLFAGGFSTAVQQAQAVPLILDSEAYEVAEELPEGTEADISVAEAAEEEEWFPADGAPRHMCTFTANVIVMWGYALMLLGLFIVRNQPVGGTKGISDTRATVWGGTCWGVVGFLVFGLAPGLNLPPELPGMVAAELEKRQWCWAFTAFMTFFGFCLLFVGELKKTWKLLVLLLGIVCIVSPHLIGSPTYDHLAGSGDRPPPELSAQFTIAALVAQSLSWVCLGMVVAVGHNVYLHRFNIGQDFDPIVGAKADDNEPSIVGAGADSNGGKV